MTKQEVFKKFGINESHGQWNPMVDNWFSVEAFRQQAGMLPNEKDAPETIPTLIAFLENKKLQAKLLKEKGLEFGSMYLSAKRALYRYMV